MGSEMCIRDRFNYIVIQVVMILFIAGDGLMALIFYIKYRIAAYVARNYWRHRR